MTHKPPFPLYDDRLETLIELPKFRSPSYEKTKEERVRGEWRCQTSHTKSQREGPNTIWVKRADEVVRKQWPCGPDYCRFFEYPTVWIGGEKSWFIPDISVFRRPPRPKDDLPRLAQRLTPQLLVAIIEVGELTCEDKLDLWRLALPSDVTIWWLPKLDLMPPRYNSYRPLRV